MDTIHAIHGDFGVLRMERKEIEVTSNAPRTDKAWTYVDQNGHEHRWRGGYPTLRWVVDGSYWCEDCRDEHEEGHWECQLCAEHISPAMLPPSGVREFLSGLASFYLNDEPISEKRYRELLAELRTAHS